MFKIRFARIRLLTLLIMLFVLVTVSAAAAGQNRGKGRVYRWGEEKYLHDILNSSKISPLIRGVRQGLKARGITRENARSRGASALSNGLVKVDEDGNIQSYIRVHTFGEAERAQLEAYEVKIEIVNQEHEIIQAWIPFDRIDEMARLPFLKQISPPGYAVTRTGLFYTQGDYVLNADQLRALGFNGTGVRVGVISDGANNRAEAEANGDLPSDITAYGPDCDPLVTNTTCNEGTAMLEIIHDLAPGAELGFCNGMTTVQMLNCVDDLANDFGAEIIVDDLGFFSEAFFEDSLVAQAVAGVVTSGVFYTSAAGNDALAYYQGVYVDSGDVFGSHQIGVGNTVFEVTGSSVTVVLQWSNRFDGTASDDYDLCLQTEVAETCKLSQDLFAPLPLEYRQEDCSGGCDFQVRLISGSEQTLELFVLGADLDDANDQVAADSIFGHPAVPGVMAAAAVRHDLDTIEPFSSRGPATILFPAPESSRPKPDLTATDGVEVSGVGGFSNPFYGTSASAPHVAGVAALLMSGGRTASAVRVALRQTAVDLGAAERDTTYGYGRIDALAANAFLEGLIQFNLQVDDDGGGWSDNFCFIAAAAHGSPKELPAMAKSIATDIGLPVAVTMLVVLMSVFVIRGFYRKVRL